MYRCLVLLVLVSIVSAAILAEGDRKPRIFKERVRTVSNNSGENFENHEEHEEDNHFDKYTQTDRYSEDKEDMTDLERMHHLANVQKQQADTFGLWSEQFLVFKRNMMKFIETTSEALKKHERKIKTLERVVKKIADNIEM